MKKFTSKTQKIGEIGEKTCEKYLKNKGFTVLEKNYTKKWGEIDLIAEKNNRIHFIEVKSISSNFRNPKEVSCETNSYKPEDNVHPWKAKRIMNTIQSYLLEKNIPENKEWQIDIFCVYLNLERKQAVIKKIEDVIF